MARSELFIFDLGNVIVKNIGILSSISKELGIREDILKDDYRKYDMAMMAGLFSVEDYYDHLREKFGVFIHDDIFRRHFHPVLNPPILEIADRLREKGGVCVIGSNTFQSHWPFIDEMGIRPHFDAAYASHLIHEAKPYAGFYLTIMNAEGFDASHTHFIDDYDVNIEGARALGIDAWHYRDDNEALSAHMEAFL